jgi:hypothetical protein
MPAAYVQRNDVVRIHDDISFLVDDVVTPPDSDLSIILSGHQMENEEPFVFTVSMIQLLEVFRAPEGFWDAQS